MLIGLCGKSGSGKSTVAKYLQCAHGYLILHPGSACRTISKILFGNTQKENLFKVDSALRSIDQNIWINCALRQANRGEDIVIDGVRYLENFHLLKPLGYRFWRVDVSFDYAGHRLKMRDGKAPDPQLLKKELGEHNFERIPFDASITNAGNKSDLYLQVESLLNAQKHNT